MKINFKALRVRMSLIYIVLTLISMVSLGCFSYWHLSSALASSRQHTMDAREHRLIKFVENWPKHDTGTPLAEKLSQLSVATAGTDTIQVNGLDGTLIYSSPGDPAMKTPWPDSPCTETCHGLVEQNGHHIRTLNQVVVLDGHKVRLSLTGSIDEHFEILSTVRNFYLVSCPIILLASILGGIVFSSRTLEPIRSIAKQAREIGIQELESRVAVPDTGDEIQMLAETWNELLARLEMAVKRLSQFTGDISHDLNTAITVMLTTAGQALSRERSKEEYVAALETVAVECNATTKLLNDLLAVTRSDLIQQNIAQQPIILGDIIREVSQQLAAQAEIKGQTLQVAVHTSSRVLGDGALLRRLVTILVDNAIKYTPDGGTIAVSLEDHDGSLQLEVKDSGIGITKDELPHIFDRFYRADGSRNQDQGSSGLGLSIAKWVVEAHLSAIDVRSTPGRGTTFSVIIPAIEKTRISDSQLHALQTQCM